MGRSWARCSKAEHRTEERLSGTEIRTNQRIRRAKVRLDEVLKRLSSMEQRQAAMEARLGIQPGKVEGEDWQKE